MTAPPDRPLTTAEVAEYLRVSESQVRTWVRGGQLGCVRLGPKLLRFRQSDIDTFLARLAKPVGRVTLTLLEDALTEEERAFFDRDATASRKTKGRASA